MRPARWASTAASSGVLPSASRALASAGSAASRRSTVASSPRLIAAKSSVPRWARSARARVRAAQFREPVLGELLQVLEAGTIGEGHDAPSFHVPGVRGIGRKVVMSASSDRWVRPFTRTVGRLDGSEASLRLASAKSRPRVESPRYVPHPSHALPLLCSRAAPGGGGGEALPAPARHAATGQQTAYCQERRPMMCIVLVGTLAQREGWGWGLPPGSRVFCALPKSGGPISWLD